jgi:hypothetical protein
MRKLATVALLLVALLVVTAAPSDAWTRGFHRGGPHVFVGFGFGPYYPYYPYYPYGYPYGYYPPPYTYSPPPVVVQEPPVYVQQPPAAVAPGPQSQSVTPEAYWYYCASAKGYYPGVQTCPEPWVKVPPRQD